VAIDLSFIGLGACSGERKVGQRSTKRKVLCPTKTAEEVVSSVKVLSLTRMTGFRTEGCGGIQILQDRYPPYWF